MGKRKKGPLSDLFNFGKGLWMLGRAPFVFLDLFTPKKKKTRTKTTTITTTYVKPTENVVVKPKRKQTREEIINNNFAKNKTVANVTKSSINKHYVKPAKHSEKDLLDELANENRKNNVTLNSDDEMLETMVLLDMMNKENNNQRKSNLLPGEQNTFMTDDDEDYDWETHCEFCGELLEDCECEHRQLSRQDISQEDDDLELDEMNDVWDESDQMEEDEEFEEDDDDLSFDNFNSFDDDDDF